jgi:hypothetical protein
MMSIFDETQYSYVMRINSADMHQRKNFIFLAFSTYQIDNWCILHEMRACAATHLERSAASRVATAFPEYFAQIANQYRSLVLDTLVVVLINQ